MRAGRRDSGGEGRGSPCPSGQDHGRARAHQRGFSLVAGMVLVALVLAGLGLAVALTARNTTADRNARTLRDLERAFRGCFPYPAGTPGADLRTDFGFAPDTPTGIQRSGDQTASWTLACLVDRTAVGAVDSTHNPVAAFNGTNSGASWNGPYWLGAVDGSGRPVDAWGRFLELRYVTLPSAGWVVHSPGADGKDDTPAGSGTAAGDDLIWPSPPYQPGVNVFPVFTAVLNLSFVLYPDGTCSPANNVDLTVVVTYQDGTQTQSLTLADPVQMHRKGNGGKPMRADYLSQSLSLRMTGGTGTLQIAVTGGCPDPTLSPTAFEPVATSGITYLGSSTVGATTTYTFSITAPTAPATSVTPWPITIRP